MSSLIFVDVEALGTSPVNGCMTEFGAVDEKTLETYHGVLYEGLPNPENPAVPIIGARKNSSSKIAAEFTAWLEEMSGGERCVFVSDNPAYDFMWIAGLFDEVGQENPFGWSGRRISDYYAGLKREWKNTQGWKKYRITEHTHHPVDDAMGNVEAFHKLQELEKELRNGKSTS